MAFNSLLYPLFLAAVLAIYQCLPHRGQNWLLLAASLFFYACWSWPLCGLLLLVAMVSRVSTVAIAAAGDDYRRVRRWLAATVTVNLGVLGLFKYFDFFVSSFGELLRGIGLTASWPVLHLVLPVGISFYTFQALGYVVDVARGKAQPAGSWLEHTLFVTFFPQLVAGPIERAATLLPQLAEPRVFTAQRFRDGLGLLLLGFFKKLAVADSLAVLVDPLFAASTPLSQGDVVLAGVLFSFQVYADFSGYTDIARGSAKLFGIELSRNFAVPYLATSVQEFWNRWHISLSAWIRDYLFYPLALHPKWGRRLGVAGCSVLTMTLMGLWHGAAWTFVVWGAFHGVLLAGYGRLRPLLRRAAAAVGVWPWRVLAWAATFAACSFSEIFFRSPTMARAWEMLSDLVSGPLWGPGTTSLLAAGLTTYSAIIVFDIADELAGRPAAILRWPWPLRLLALSMVCGALLLALSRPGAATAQPFHYFQF